MHGTIELSEESHLRAARDRANSLPLAEFESWLFREKS